MRITNARVLNTITKELGNVVHAVIVNANGRVARCKVHGGWTLVETTDAVSCGTCRKKVLDT